MLGSFTYLHPDIEFYARYPLSSPDHCASYFEAKGKLEFSLEMHICF